MRPYKLGSAQECRQANLSRRKYQQELARLARARLSRLKQDFRRAFPHHSLHIIFGNGTEAVQVDGRNFHFYEQGSPDRTWFRTKLASKPSDDCFLENYHERPAPCLEEICRAIVDVQYISSVYTDCTVSDVEVKAKPRKRRVL